MPWTRLAVLLGIELAIALVGEGLSRVSALLESLLGDLFANRTSVQLMQHAAALDLEQFEDAEIYDKLERARRQTVGRIGLFTMLLATLQDLITLISLAAALAVYVPWLLVLLVVAVLPSLLGETHFASLGYSLLYSWTPERRQLDYLRYIGASDISAKELKLFGLSDFLVGRYDRLSEEFYEANKSLAVRRSVVSTLLSFVGTLGYYGAYAVIIYLTVIGHQSRAGVFTIGVLTFLAGSFRQSRDLIQRVLLSLSQVFEQSLYLDDLFTFLDIEPSIRPQPGAKAGAGADPDRVRLRGGGVPLPRLGALGRAGARLLALPGRADRAGRRERRRQDHAGQAAGPALRPRRGADPARRGGPPGVRHRQPRRNIGVIFQDFVRYDFMLKENIAVGNIGRLEDEPAIHEPRPSGAWPIRSPGGSQGKYDQMLGKRFDGGVDLSGGEWQKVALARAYMRDAQLLILDEPTAALDARAEYEVFLRFSELTKGRMAVLISHRFSTVRMADRILVLKGGELVEQGTHEALVELGGLYAELFQLQAAGYR